MKQQGKAAYRVILPKFAIGSNKCVYRAVCSEELRNKYNSYFMIYLLVSKRLISKKESSLSRMNPDTFWKYSSCYVCLSVTFTLSVV